MKSIVDRRPSPAMIVACLALAVALGGTSYAAISLPKNSVGTTQLRRNAVVSSKVKKNSLTGRDIREASLARVPKAVAATRANTATHATTAGAANAAVSIYHEPPVSLATSAAPILTLSVPKPGSYVIFATFTAIDSSPVPGDASCSLWAGVDGDGVATRGAGTHVEQAKSAVMALQLPFRFVRAGHAQLLCQDFGVGDVRAEEATITAIQVAQLTATEGG
jgi:hypothetical protein